MSILFTLSPIAMVIAVMYGITQDINHGINNLISDMKQSYRLLFDFQSYIDCQTTVSSAYGDPKHWTRMSIINVARMGKFSSDLSIEKYCREIWKVKPVKISLITQDQANEDLLL